MPLRRIALLCALLLLLSACSPKTETLQSENANEPEVQSSSVSADNTAAPAMHKQAPQLIGFVINDDASVESSLLMHGFLHMAENIGYPAKLYRANAGDKAMSAVESAIADECKGLLIQNKNGANDEAVKKAIEAGIKVVVPYDKCSVEGIGANVTVDDSEYVEEITRSIASRMTERSLKSGRILIYYQNAQEAPVQAFYNAVSTYYPQYGTVEFIKSATEDEAAIAELSDYLLFNRDIKGMYVAEPSLAAIAVKARNDAQSRFKKDGAPSPSPSLRPSTSPGQTPAPTVAPGLLTQISITVFACGQSQENYFLLQSSDVYGLCIEPYYDVAAQATMTLDQLLSGDLVSKESRVNRPIVTANSIEKYMLIFNQAQELFALPPQ